MRHVLEKHTQCEISYCPICDGGLSLCTVCNGAESSLPKDCPGRLMTLQEQEAVSNGILDFVSGGWVTGSYKWLKNYRN